MRRIGMLLRSRDFGQTIALDTDSGLKEELAERMDSATGLCSVGWGSDEPPEWDAIWPKVPSSLDLGKQEERKECT